MTTPQPQRDAAQVTTPIFDALLAEFASASEPAPVREDLDRD